MSNDVGLASTSKTARKRNRRAEPALRQPKKVDYSGGRPYCIVC
jgi:hypothetical protein